MDHIKRKLHEVIFEAETPLGKWFDILLLWAILASVLMVVLESVQSINAYLGPWIKYLEWFFTILFTLEYILRIYSVEKARKYIFSFYGMIDLLAVLPSYLSLYFASAHSLLVIRTLRMLRVFRIFKLGRYVGEAQVLLKALSTSRPKITVFLVTVLSLVTITGTLMYMIEGAEHGFTSIPRSIYWAIVTMTTVGYGDLSPQTPTGQFLASIIMIMGYGIIAVPTGIVSVELAKASDPRANTICCPSCALEGHDPLAKFCRQCGSQL